MYYSAPDSLGFWWWFYNTPKARRVLQFHDRFDDSTTWSAQHYLTDSAARTWWMDAMEHVHSPNARYDDVHLYTDRGQGWVRTH